MPDDQIVEMFKQAFPGDGVTILNFSEPKRRGKNGEEKIEPAGEGYTGVSGKPEPKRETILEG